MSTTTTSIEEKFIQASRTKLRFSSGRGALAVEDLWDLSIEDLDRIAVSIVEVLDQTNRRSFIEQPTKEVKRAQLAFDIVKHILDTRVAEKEAAKVRAARSKQREFLRELLEKKQTETLEALSTDEIKQRLAELEAEPEV